MTIELKIISLDLDSEEASRTAYYDKEEIAIGRGDVNDLVLDRPEISSEHARIRLKTGFNGDESSLFITDLGSIHGTRVEDLALYPNFEVGLSSNERVVIGNYLIRVAILDPEEVPEDAEVISISKASSDAEQEEVPVEEQAKAVEETEADERKLTPLTKAKREEETDDGEPEAAEIEEVEVPSENENTESKGANDMKDNEQQVSGKVEDQEIILIDFSAIAVFTIEGTVIHKGKPLEGVQVDGGSLGRRVTGSNGKFSFEDVAEDSEYEIIASKENYKFEYTGGNKGVLDSNKEIDISCSRRCTIKGRVVHKGLPLVGVEIDGGELGSAVTDDEGYYSFSDVEEDTVFELKASKDGFVFSYTGVTK